ncbi:unnamed protein product [Rotaria socialis]|uniref:Uncharacterized protein n=1 Tax=Rotaria socialis TaxID=392032 RepID=A0A821B7M0_9BILA|nr:unnamed protein product [Rotaria socialis]CAF4409989.1 unnamed protein product [Rotaria socialis]CAF4517284.1 unnamed protein product [Rotaria socialis]CAF4587901.1 unnamed protein product [Rotaria socialis]CAF4763227.1 unnamed protein product [Rotaria socialis]
MQIIRISDQLYIDFSSSNSFDQAFEELIAEIEAIQSEDQGKAETNKSIINETTHRDRNTSIHNCQGLFRMSDNDLQILTKEEFIEYITILHRQHFNETKPFEEINHNNKHEHEKMNNQQILQQLLI